MLLSDSSFMIVGITLILQSYWDIRYKEIPLIITVVSGVLGFLLSVMERRDLVELLLAVIPGIICLGIGRVTSEMIGYGDGFLLCAMGMCLSYDQILSICMMAFVVGGVFALGCLVLKRKRGKDELPFVPFLFVAWMIHCLIVKGIIT